MDNERGTINRLSQRRDSVKTLALLTIRLSNAILEHDANLLQLVRDAYQLAGVNVKVEIGEL